LLTHAEKLVLGLVFIPMWTKPQGRQMDALALHFEALLKSRVTLIIESDESAESSPMQCIAYAVKRDVKLYCIGDMIGDDSELAHKVRASVSWLLNKLVQQSDKFTIVKWMLFTKNDKFNPELLYCIVTIQPIQAIQCLV